MDREPGDFSRDGPDASDGSEDAIDRVLAELPIPPGIKYIDDDTEEDEARALADVAAGRYHDHAVVSKWLMTWGEPDQKSFKEWLAEQDG